MPQVLSDKHGQPAVPAGHGVCRQKLPEHVKPRLHDDAPTAVLHVQPFAPGLHDWNSHMPLKSLHDAPPVHEPVESQGQPGDPLAHTPDIGVMHWLSRQLRPVEQVPVLVQVQPATPAVH
jgi:hypothetical protein